MLEQSPPEATPTRPPDLESLRAKVLVIFAAAESQPLRIGYAARRITNEVIAPLLEREQRVRAVAAHPWILREELLRALDGPQGDGSNA